MHHRKCEVTAGNSRMPSEHSQFPSEELLIRTLGFARHGEVCQRQLSEPFELGPAEGGAKGERARQKALAGRQACPPGIVADGLSRWSEEPPVPSANLSVSPCPLCLASVVRHTAIPLNNTYSYGGAPNGASLSGQGIQIPPFLA